MGFSNLFQANKIFKRKSAKDISIITYPIIFIGSATWVLYGIEIMNMPIIFSNLVGTLVVFLVIIGWILYGKNCIKIKH